MDLPELPKKHNKKEAKSGLDFKKWVEENPQRLVAGSYEMKDTNGKGVLYYKAITDKQFISGIKNKSRTGNLIRVISGTVGAADYIFLKESGAYIVVKYPTSIEIIDVETMLIEAKKGKASLSAERARDISIISIKGA